MIDILFQQDITEILQNINVWGYSSIHIYYLYTECAIPGSRPNVILVRVRFMNNSIVRITRIFFNLPEWQNQYCIVPDVLSNTTFFPLVKQCVNQIRENYIIITYTFVFGKLLSIPLWLVHQYTNLFNVYDYSFWWCTINYYQKLIVL